MNDDNSNVTLGKFKAFIDTLDTSPDQEALTKAHKTLGALISDKPALTHNSTIYNTARVMMASALINAKPELAIYINALADDAKELMFIENMRRAYGDEMVDAALDDARTSYRTFYHSLQLRIMAQYLSGRFDALYQTIADFGNVFSSTLRNVISEQLGRAMINVPGNDAKNREERRSAKYGTRRKKEGDQLWARRNNPKRRR